MKNFQILLLSASVLSILSLANINGEEIAERGGGGGGGAHGYSHDYNRESSQYHNQGNAQYHNYGDAYRRDGYGAGYGGYYGGGYYGGAPAYPAYGYPAGGYLYPPGPVFPGEAEADAIYRANQHPPQ